MDGGVDEGLLEAKIRRLIDAINQLIPASVPVSANMANTSIATTNMDIDAILAPPMTDLNHARIPASVIDVDSIPNFLSPTTTAKKNDRIPCQGLKICPEPGRSIHSEYPFNLHTHHSLPWTYHVKGEEMFLHSDYCTRFCYSDPCIKCLDLRKNVLLSGILQRMSTGAREHTPWVWLSHAQIEERAHRLERQLNAVKLHALNTGNKLARRTTVLDEHKRFLLSIATGNVSNIQHLVAVALNSRVGIRTIIERIESAAQDLYSVKSYEERDYEIAMLLWRYGGARVAEIAHKTLGLPGRETIRKSKCIVPLQVSPRYPTSQEIIKNMSGYDFSGMHSEAGCILMVDELATESRLRYDASNNTILGICRKHSRGYTLTFNGLEEADVLLKGLQDRTVHFASEATVVAIGSLHPGRQVRQALPVAISGTCKHESAEEHLHLLKTVIYACEQMLRRPIYCIALDGESKRSLALNYITTSFDLTVDSALYPILGELLLFDIKIGPNEVTVDKDYKHIFKRFRNAIIRPTGILIDGTLLTPQIIRQHLSDSSSDTKCLDSMLNPNDPQDVPLAISLLALIWNLPQPTIDKPTYHAT